MFPRLGDCNVSRSDSVMASVKEEKGEEAINYTTSRISRRVRVFASTLLVCTVVSEREKKMVS